MEPALCALSRVYGLHEVFARPTFEEVGILLDVASILARHIILVEDGLLLTFEFAGTTLDAVLGRDVVGRPLRVIFDEEDGIAWAGLYAGATALTLTGDYISHFSFASILI
jgi:hypothetical protein